jgi:aspartate/tyrosine/aromatic aminotransferase
MGIFSEIQMAPTDPILGTSLACTADPDPRKINLGVGAYRTEEGKPFVLNVVKKAEEEILAETGTTINKEYSTIDGPPLLKTLTQKLAFGDDCEAVTSGRIASAQGLSGTGSLRVAGEFFKAFLKPEAHEIWLSNPTWGNHHAIFKKAGLTVKEYPYYKPETRGFDFEGMMKALKEDATPGCVVVLHACAHNPTGVDPTEEQWREIAAVFKEKNLIPLLDSAYQGYASGSLDKDAFATRLFQSMGFEMFLCQSFAKNLGLYGERIGMLHVVTSSADEAKIVLSQMKMVIRPMYSSPPIHGGLLVMKILGDPANLAAWKAELAGMAERILEVRSLLRKGLEEKGTPGTWNHITDQIGMFSFTGLTPAQCARLISEHHIYLLKSGRISLAGLNKSNIQYMVDSVDEVVRACP